MRLVKKGGAWEVPGRGGFYLGEKTHNTDYLPGATRLSFSAERTQVEGHAFIHTGIYLQDRKVHVTFSREKEP